MQPILDVLGRVGVLLNTGIAGSEFTPFKLLIVITLIILFGRNAEERPTFGGSLLRPA